MLEAGAAIPEINSQQGLFLIDEGVDPDVTSLFLRANIMDQAILVSTVGIFKRAAEKYEKKYGMPEHGGMNSGAGTSAGFEAIETYPEFARKNEWPYTSFRDGLTDHNSTELDRIETELTGLLMGDITLTDAQKQQLSNISDGGLQHYLAVSGIVKEELEFPLLDVGTGLTAMFAQDVIRNFPDAEVISTSMHLHSPKSLMNRVLAGIDPESLGELVACDGTNMPFEDEKFGMVVSVNADPYYVPRKDLLASLREKNRVLKVGATALLCPAICEYGLYEITENDLVPLRDEVDVTLHEIPDSGRHSYRGDVKQMLVISK